MNISLSTDGAYVFSNGLRIKPDGKSDIGSDFDTSGKPIRFFAKWEETVFYIELDINALTDAEYEIFDFTDAVIIERILKITPSGRKLPAGLDKKMLASCILSIYEELDENFCDDVFLYRADFTRSGNVPESKESQYEYFCWNCKSPIQEDTYLPYGMKRCSECLCINYLVIPSYEFEQ